MQAQPTGAAQNGLCVAHGYGLKIHVDRGHLIVHDGICDERRTRRYHRATSKLRRLVVIGHSGYVTLDALRWLHDIGAALIHVDRDGKLITTSAPSGPGLASLRRAQALAATSTAGVEIARELLHTKVAGQASLLPELNASNEAERIMTRALDMIRVADDVSALLGAEAEAAAAYWQAWSTVEVPIGDRGRRGTPEHWQTFGKRHSPLSNGPRLACNPPNAILNYLYSLLEAETVLACHAVGLDPHARDLPHRPAQPLLARARRHGTRPTDCRRVRARAPHPTNSVARGLQRDPTRQLPHHTRLDRTPSRNHRHLAASHRPGRRRDKPAPSPQGNRRSEQHTAHPRSTPRGLERPSTRAQTPENQGVDAGPA